MTAVELTGLIFGGSILAGLVGSLTGLGGGMVIVPMLTIGFNVNLRYAIGASLISVIATSSGAAAAYVKEGYSNVRLGMFLEVATTVGALVGAFLTSSIPTRAVAIVFAGMLLYSAYLSTRPRVEHISHDESDPWARRLKLNSTYPTPAGWQPYGVRNVGGGFGLMFVAGILSGLLGIGSGAVKVLAMDHVMRLPFKVSTTTSNFMIGVTAAASAGVYLRQGYIDPVLSVAVMLGVLAGAMSGAHILARAHPTRLRWIFSLVIVALAIEMVFKAFSGTI